MTVDRNVICALNANVDDNCFVDSGGPLVVNVKDTWYMVGVMAYRPDPCTSKTLPTIYTYMSQHLHWIYETVKP